MNVESSDLALIFGRPEQCGKRHRVLWPNDVHAVFGYLWTVRLVDFFELVVPDLHLMCMDEDSWKDRKTRELLSKKYQILWDAWMKLPEIDC